MAIDNPMFCVITFPHASLLFDVFVHDTIRKSLKTNIFELCQNIYCLAW